MIFFGSLEQGVTVSYTKDMDVPIWDIYSDDEDAGTETMKDDLISCVQHDDHTLDFK